MSIGDVGEALKVLNPYKGANPLGNCAHCAVETANLLISTGKKPAKVDGKIASFGDYGDKLVQKFGPDDELAKDVLKWLQSSAMFPGGVYAVETEDHAYNFVKDTKGRVYVLDSNQHFFKEIKQVDDFKATVCNATLNDTIDYNYGDPLSCEETDDLDIYLWGKLSEEWLKLLEQ